MISGQQAFFFLATWWAGYFFPSKCSAEYFFFLFISLQDFFFLKKVSCAYIYRMYLHLHCGYCCNSSILELQSLKMLSAIQNHAIQKHVFGKSFFTLI